MRLNHSTGLSAGLTASYSNQRTTEKTLTQLATGLRINSASDDAAGLAISENLRTQVRGSNQARKNAQDGISLLSVADGAASEITNTIQRMRELAVQAATDTMTDSERSYLQVEYSQLQTEIDRIAETTKFNNQHLLSGTSGFGTSGFSTLHIGANAGTADEIDFAYGQLKTSDIGLSDQILNGTFTFTGNFGGYGSPSFTIEFDGTSNARGTLQSASSGGSYAPAPNGSLVTGIEFYNANGETVSVKDFLANPSLVHFVGGDFATDSIPTTSIVNGVPQVNSAGVAWRQWPIGGSGNYTPSGTADSNGALERPTSNIGTQTGAADAIFVLDSALENTNQVRSNIGAYINRLTSTVNNLMSAETNQQAAESLIRDTDFAETASTFTKQQILAQSSTGMIAQANLQSRQILNLIK